MQVVQVVAKTLGVPLDLVKVKPSNVLTGPNNFMTAGSVTSELNCLVSGEQHETNYRVIINFILCSITVCTDHLA